MVRTDGREEVRRRQLLRRRLKIQLVTPRRVLRDRNDRRFAVRTALPRNALFSLLAAFPFFARFSLFSAFALCSGFAFLALNALLPLFAAVTLLAPFTGVSFFSLDALFALLAGVAFFAAGAGDALLSLRAGAAAVALYALRADLSLHPLLAAFALFSPRPFRPHRPDRPLNGYIRPAGLRLIAAIPAGTPGVIIHNQRPPDPNAAPFYAHPSPAVRSGSPARQISALLSLWFCGKLKVFNRGEENNVTYRIAICDDDPAQAEALRAAVAAWSKTASCACTTDCYPSAEALWFACADGAPYDIFLLDVEMKAMSGIDFAKRLRRAGSRAELIFVTSHFEFIGEGYEVDALHYLVKPVAPEKLAAVLSRAAERLAIEPPSFLITVGGETVKLFESDLLYAESFLHDLVLHTAVRDYRIKENISAFAERLSADFFRVHRSYLVNLKAVIRIGRTSLTLSSGAEVPVARGKYDAVNRAFIERN